MTAPTQPLSTALSKAPDAPIALDGRCFSFTGGMASLKRAAAEREVRARGGQTADRVSQQLDYLVFGDAPATGWKHGL